jgi:polyisoprenoid-binding protein YceI
MTNYRSALVLAALIGGAACADDKTPPATRPTTSNAAARPATTTTTTTVTPAGPVPAPPAASGTPQRYVQAPGSSLGFSFEQAGAQSNGVFKQFATTLDYDAGNLAASRLDVKVQIGSLDTQDKDRDTTLAGADLFDTQKYPAATYTAGSLAKGANGIEAVGKLTIRGVTKDLRVPLAIKPVGGGLELSGSVTIKRLDFGVGQGEWKSTEWVGDAVKVTYKVVLARAAR